MAAAGNGIWRAGQCCKDDCVAVVDLRVVDYGTRGRARASVWVQIDTAAGEVREVIDGMFQSYIMLVNCGFDAIDAVDVVAARSGASFGQVQISIKGIGPVPVGDGLPLLTAALCSRLASDFGLKNAHPLREVTWGWPLAAS